MPMSKASRVARRIATAAAYGGGGISLLGGALIGLLLTEVQLAKRRSAARTTSRRGPTAVTARPSAGCTRDGRCGWPSSGDSTAAGQGVHLPRQTPGALLASALAAVAERPVELRQRRPAPGRSRTIWSARSRCC